MRIGELARAVGIKVVTIRFYEGEGLVPPPARTGGGYRDYGPDAIARLRFIRRAQELGFSLSELRALLALSDGRVPSRAEVLAVARTKLDDLARRIDDLARMRAAIQRRLRATRRGAPPGKACPIIASLADVAVAPPRTGGARHARGSRR